MQRYTSICDWWIQRRSENMHWKASGPYLEQDCPDKVHEKIQEDHPPKKQLQNGV